MGKALGCRGMGVRSALALLAPLAVLAVTAAPASAVLINFDDLNAPSHNAPGLIVNTQYATPPNNLGVVFPDLRAHDYSKTPGAIPGFPHSGNVAVENCFAAEFCFDPLSASFTTGQDLVRAWVGFTVQPTSPVRVRMTAFNGASTAIASTTETINPPALPTDPPHIGTALTVTRPTAVIRRIDISVLDNGGYTNGLVFDDLEFSNVGPPPPCNTTSVPSVSLSQPPAGLVVHGNQFPLAGSVDRMNAPITSAALTATGATGSRTAPAYPGTVDADGGLVGPVNAGGFLEPGVNSITLSATNCRGTGTSAPTTVIFSPIPADTQFRQLGQIEVNQSVQNPDNGVPLLGASGFGVKRTFARVYLRSEGGLPQIRGVSGALSAIRPDGSRPPGPDVIRSLNTVDVNRDATLLDVRPFPERGLNFELPPEWLGVGKLHLEIDHLSIGGVRTGVPCRDCTNIDGNGPSAVGPAVVEFRTSPPLRLTLVDIPYMFGTPATTVRTRPLDFDMFTSWLRRAYPTSNIQIRRRSLPVQAAIPASCNEANAELLEWAGPVWLRPDRYYGMISDVADFTVGCVIKNAAGDDVFGGHFGSGPAGPDGGFAWDTDGSYADWYSGHELAHQLNRRHPGYQNDSSGTCTTGLQNDDDAGFPYAGLIGSALYDNQGLDAGDASLGLPFEIGDWRSGWHDVMTYCDDQWLSAYTYTQIMKFMCTGDGLPYCLNTPIVKRAGRQGAATQAAKPKGGPRLLLTAELRGGRLRLDPLSVLPKISLTDRPKKSSYSIVLRGARGKVLARYPFSPGESSDQPDGRGRAPIHEVVRFDGATERIVVVRGKKVLDAVDVSDHSPKVRIVSPKGKAKLGDRVKVRWRARDADGGRLTHTLLYAPDGKNFTTVAGGLRKRSYRVDLGELGGGRKARFKVITTDGVLTDVARSKPISAPVKPPVVSIATPASGAELPASQSFTLAASAEDLQDGTLRGARIVWHSSLQGSLGTGAAISARLQPGVHEITATAINSEGASGAAVVKVTAVAEPPAFNRP